MAGPALLGELQMELQINAHWQDVT